MSEQRLDWLRPSYEGPASWLWFAGVARIFVLIFAFIGAYFINRQTPFEYLLGFYGLGFLSSLWYLFCLGRETRLASISTWVQIFIDFGVMVATVNFTGGPGSFFTFLFVLVILEVGLLLGLVQAFVFASLAAGFMLALLLFPPADTALPELVEQWTRFLVQAMAYFLTAFISGYWNQRVHRMREFQREILDNMSSGFLITDVKGRITAQNRAGHQILALGEGEAIGRPVEEVIRMGEGHECPILTVLRSGKDFTSYEFYGLTATEETKLLGLTTNRLLDARGRLRGLIASFSDLTEMARMREELQRQDRMAVVGELAAGLAHEIRNPVAVIRGAVDELRGNLDSRPMAETLIDMAIKESDHLNNIVSEFLDFARNPTIRRERVDLRDLVENVASLLLRKNSNWPKLAIAVNCPEDGCIVSGDWTRLKQVFVNLSTNAIEAMEGRGTLTISVLRTDGPLEVRFEDEGCGIPPDRVGRIFELFYTTKESGVGMGLAVCLRIITAHDGDIQAVSREGGGTTMVVRLPAAPSQNEE